MNLLIISGSPRSGSLTHRLALHLEAHFKQHTGHNINLISLQSLDIPQLQAVWSSPEKAPVALQEMSRQVFDTDAFILVSPEYNGSYSPAMKNLLDHFPKQHHKPFGIVTASPGALGGIRAALQMQQLVTALFGTLSSYMLVAPFADKKFDETGNLTEASFQGSIDQFVYEFLWLAERLVPVKELETA